MRHICTVILVAWTALLIGCTQRGEAKPQQPSPAPDHSPASTTGLPPEPLPTTEQTLDPALIEKRIEYLDTMQDIVEITQARYKNGHANITLYLEAQLALSEAELAFASTKEQRLAALEASLQTVKEGEKYQQARIKAAPGGGEEMAGPKAARLHVEILILEETNRDKDNLRQTSPATDHSPASTTEQTPDSALIKKRIEYRDAMKEVVKLLHQHYMQVPDNINFVLEAQLALTNAELALASTKEQRLAVLEASLQPAKQLEKYQQVRIERGAGLRGEMAGAKAARLHVEILILEETNREKDNQQQPSPATDHSPASTTERTPDSALIKKRIEYRDAMKEVVELLHQRYMQVQDNIKFVLEAQLALTDAELALASTKEQRLAVLEASLQPAKQLEMIQQARINAGVGRTDEMLIAKAARLHFEILILEETNRDE